MIISNKNELQIAYEEADKYVATATNTDIKSAYIQGRLEAVADYNTMIDYANKLVEENNKLKAQLSGDKNE